MVSCSSCYKATCPGAESCATLYAISDLVVAYANQSDQTPIAPVNTPTPDPTPRTAQQLPTEQARVDASDSHDEENWDTKLAIEATECIFRDVQLSAPPFPFKQRWDADARQVINERKNHGRKRKRREYEEYEEDWEEDYENYDNEEFQRIYDALAAAVATVTAENSSAHPAKRRKKAMRKRKQGGGGAADGEGVASPAPAGNSA